MAIPKHKEAVDYEGRDLEAMSFAVNYHRWILSIFQPHLGRRVIEVGAGTGQFSELLLKQPLDSLTLVEPSVEMHSILKNRLSNLNTDATAEIYNGVFREIAGRLEETVRPDSILYVNVLEHIRDDEAELRLAYDTLVDGGRVFIFVPALESLHGAFDKRIGHYRRYRRSQLSDLCERVGFKILEARYFDLVGIVPWWVKYRLLGSNTLQPKLVDIYDRYLVPMVRAVESLMSPPVGKNILLVAEKRVGQVHTYLQ